LDVLSDIFSRGRTSRFYKNIQEKKLGNVRAGISFSRYPDLFSCSITPIGDHGTDEVIDSVLVEIERTKTQPVENWEIEKVRNQADADFVRSLASNSGMAWQIGNMEAMAGDWRYLMAYRDLVKKVTPDDLIRVATTYLIKSNRTIVTLIPVKKEPPADAGLQGRKRP